MSKVAKVLLFLTFWWGTGALGYGIMLAHLRHEVFAKYTRCREDAAFSAGMGLLFGPFDAFISLATSGFAEDGLQFTCKQAVSPTGSK